MVVKMLYKLYNNREHETMDSEVVAPQTLKNVKHGVYKFRKQVEYGELRRRETR